MIMSLPTIRYVGPRSYIPAGSYPARVIDVPGISPSGFGEAPTGNAAPSDLRTVVKSVALSVTVMVLSQLVLRWWDRR
jgi:hypothetical protein